MLRFRTIFLRQLISVSYSLAVKLWDVQTLANRHGNQTNLKERERGTALSRGVMPTGLLLG